MKRQFALIAAGILLIANSCTTVTKTDSSSAQTTTENTIIGKMETGRTTWETCS